MVLLVSWLVTGFASLLDTQLCRRSAPGKTLLPSPYRLLESDLEAAWIGRAIQDRVGRKQCGTAAGAMPVGIVLSILGFILVSYSIYALITPKLPELKPPAWAFGFGFLGGLLSGAYNVAGPAAVIYGNCRGWRPDEFKSNLQAFFIVNDLTVLLSHTLAGNLTPTVWSNYLIALPAIGLGIFIGLKVDRRIDPATFKKIVLVLLIVMGARLIISSIT